MELLAKVQIFNAAQAQHLQLMLIATLSATI